MTWLWAIFFLALATLVTLIVLSLIGSEEPGVRHGRDPPSRPTHR